MISHSLQKLTYLIIGTCLATTLLVQAAPFQSDDYDEGGSAAAAAAAAAGSRSSVAAAPAADHDELGSRAKKLVVETEGGKSKDNKKTLVRNELVKNMPTVLIDIKSPGINGNNEKKLFNKLTKEMVVEEFDDTFGGAKSTDQKDSGEHPEKGDSGKGKDKPKSNKDTTTAKHGSTTSKPGAASTTGKPTGASSTGKPPGTIGKPGASTTGKPHSGTTAKPGAGSTTGKPGTASTTGKPSASSSTGKPAAGSTTGKPASTAKPGVSTTGKPGAHSPTGKPGAHSSGKPGAASTTGKPVVASTTGKPTAGSTTGKPPGPSITGHPSVVLHIGPTNPSTTSTPILKRPANGSSDGKLLALVSGAKGIQLKAVDEKTMKQFIKLTTAHGGDAKIVNKGNSIVIPAGNYYVPRSMSVFGLE